MLKLRHNPPVRPTLTSAAADVTSVRDFVGDWWIAHTKARNEKAFAWDLLRRRVGYFLPMVEKITFSGGRKRCNLAPVFGGYVFFCGTNEDRYEAMCTGRLCNAIAVRNPQQLVAELAQIEIALQASADLELYPQLAIGRRVRVSAGPMQGIFGTILARRAGDETSRTIILNIGVLGQGAAISIAPSLLVPVDAEEAASELSDDGGTPAGARRPSYMIIEPPRRGVMCGAVG